MKSITALMLLAAFAGPAAADAETDRIAAERAAANAKFAEQARDCESRFVVSPCVEAARKEQRATLSRLREQELTLDEARRRAAAEARRKAIAEKAEAQQSRASDAVPEAPRVHTRRAPQPAPVPSPHARTEPPLPHGAASGATDRAAIERANTEKYEQRQQEAEAHRAAVERRNAERAAEGKNAKPLPVPPGASSAR